jgi:transforming growth factor-beta-induced protein
MKQVISAPLLSPLFLLCSFASGQTVSEVVAADATLTIFNNALNSTNGNVFLDSGTSTLFAPTDDAFAAMDQTLLSKYLEPAWTYHLIYLVSNHIVWEEIVGAAELTNGLEVETLTTEITGFDPLLFTVDTEEGGGVFASGLVFNLSEVIETDIAASNGLVHKVDQVLLPGSLFLVAYNYLEATEAFSSFLSLFDRTGLSSVLLDEQLNLTVFAPPDDVLQTLLFAALDAYDINEILLNHVVIADPIISDFFSVGLVTEDGFSFEIGLDYEFTTAAGYTYNVTTDLNGTYYIGDVMISILDNPVYNGIFHVIEGILLPPPGTISSTNSTLPPGIVPSDPPTVMGTEPPGIVSSNPPPMINETRTPGIVSSDPPVVDATERPMVSPDPSTAGSVASPNSMVGTALLLVASSLSSMMLL